MRHLIEPRDRKLVTCNKNSFKKNAEATGDLIGNKIADKITSVSKKKSNNSNNNNNNNNNEDV